MRNKYLFIIALFLGLFNGFSLIAQDSRYADAVSTVWPKGKGLSFFIVSDPGRNGFDPQKVVAERIGDLAGMINPKFIVSTGDIFHFKGVESVNDPLWISNFESIYAHPDLMCPWYIALGNHEHDGSTKAIFDYSKISRRWKTTSNYYTQVHRISDKSSLRILYIDTTPLQRDPSRPIDPERFPELALQDPNRQLHWIDSVLTVNKETWTIVVGHHQIYSNNSLAKKEYQSDDEMIKKVDPLLKKHKVDFYFSGHCHNFQHIHHEDTNLEYVINTSAGIARPVDDKGGKGTLFCSPREGFMACAITDNEFHFWLIDFKGNVTYDFAKKK